LETRQRILEVFKRQFKSADIGDLGLPFEDLRMGAVEEWDSLGNLNLLLQIESEFSVRLTTEELASIDSLVQIEAYLAKQATTKS
jgi:acyl carrier protein